MTGSPDTQYTVVARRYRPQAFGDLVGQNHVVQALSNAITSSRVGHAYLFTGARGVGKTSSARIFAKCLNCEKGPTTTPCTECDICQAISVGEDVDVLEIDGASNRGIEEIRQLRSNANVRPSRCRFKIYIIDEVHMLTQAAFNALLKTLEEPPEHVKFIFCTTDPQKIPITVLSRCQRFDFAPVKSDKITDRLREIATDEGVSADDDALALLARRANGSMRDSQSLLEQLLSFCGEHISAADVNQLLGTADIQMVARIAEGMAATDSAATLSAINEGLGQGVDAGQLAQQLLGYFRDLMAAKVGCDAELLLFSAAGDMDGLKKTAERLGLEMILSIIQILDQSVVRMQHSLHARTLLEVAAVRVCNLQNIDSISDLVNAVAEGKPLSVAPTSAPAKVARTSSAPTTAPVSPAKKNEIASNNPANRQPVPAPGPPATSAPTAPTKPSALQITTANVESLWKQAIANTATMTREMASDYKSIEFVAPNLVKVTLTEKYNQQMCSRPDRLKSIEDALANVAGGTPKIEFYWDETSVAKKEPPKPKLSRRQQIRELEQHEVVQHAIEVFDAEVVDYKTQNQK